MPGLGLADALKRPRRQDPQQLDLNGRIQLADLVEKHRPFLRTRLEPSTTVLQRARKGPFAVTEQLRLDEGRRRSRTLSTRPAATRAASC